MTTVFRLPEEPPVGTTVRPEPDNGQWWTRFEDDKTLHWMLGERIFEMGISEMASAEFRDWPALLRDNPSGLVVVEPDPHPTPWTCATGIVYDANDKVIADFNINEPNNTAGYQLARRVVLLINADAVNKAATT